MELLLIMAVLAIVLYYFRDRIDWRINPNGSSSGIGSVSYKYSWPNEHQAVLKMKWCEHLMTEGECPLHGFSGGSAVSTCMACGNFAPMHVRCKNANLMYVCSTSSPSCKSCEDFSQK